MPVFHQPIRIEQQLGSIAQFGGTKIPDEFKKQRCYDDARKFFDKDATIGYKKKQAKCFKVDKIKTGDFIRTPQMVK